MSTDKWGYTAIDTNGKTLADADSYDELKQKLNVSPYCIYHHEDKESGNDIKTTLVIDEPKNRNEEVLGAIAKSLKKPIMDVKRML